MFTQPRPGTIACDEGWQVRSLGRIGVQYGEGERTMEIDAEVLMGQAGLALYTSSIRNWSPPYDHEVLGDADRERIVENVRRAYKFLGYDIHIYRGHTL